MFLLVHERYNLNILYVRTHLIVHLHTYFFMQYIDIPEKDWALGDPMETMSITEEGVHLALNNGLWSLTQRGHFRA